MASTKSKNSPAQSVMQRVEELENGRQATVTDAQIQTILTGKDYVCK